MNLEALANSSWREALVAIIALLVLYVLFALFRMRRLRREKAAGLAASGAAQSAVASYAAAQEEPLLSPDPEPAIEPAFAWNEPPPEFPGQRRIESLERELAYLRSEVATLNDELALMRDESRRELSQARVAQNASPIYSDAMQMAMQGHDAMAISEHCGIARAEAELVVALVRNRDDGL